MWTKIATFRSTSHRSMSPCTLPELLLWQKYYAKNYSAFLQKFLWITSTSMKLLSGCQVLAAFHLRNHRNVCQLTLPKLFWQRYHSKNHSTFLQKFLWITSNIMKHLSESQNSSARNFSKLFIASNMRLSAIWC